MPMLSKTYEREAEFLLPYVLPLLQTSLTISVYSTVAITLHGLHEVRKSAKMVIPMSSSPSNVNGDLIEYESMITPSGVYKKWLSHLLEAKIASKGSYDINHSLKFL